MASTKRCTYCADDTRYLDREFKPACIAHGGCVVPIDQLEVGQRVLDDDYEYAEVINIAAYADWTLTVPGTTVTWKFPNGRTTTDKYDSDDMFEIIPGSCTEPVGDVSECGDNAWDRRDGHFLCERHAAAFDALVEAADLMDEEVRCPVCMLDYSGKHEIRGRYCLSMARERAMKVNADN